MALDTNKFFFAVQIACEADVPILAWGDTGVGKSSITKQAAQELYRRIIKDRNTLFNTDEVNLLIDKGDYPFTFEDLRLAHTDTSDWGIPRVYAEIRNNGKLVLVPEASYSHYLDTNPDSEFIDFVHRYTRPNFWPEKNYNGLFVFFLDEVNRGTKQAINGAMEVLAERSLRNRPGPDGLRIVGAANPNEDGFTTEEMDDAMKARWSHVKVITDTSAFLKARSSYVDEISKQILITDKASLVKRNNETTSDWKLDDQILWRPRTWEYQSRLANWASRYYQTPQWNKNLEVTLQELMQGLVGPSHAATWMRAFLSGEYYSIPKLLKGDIDFKSMFTSGNQNKLIGLCWSLANSLTDNDLIHDTERNKIDENKVKNLVLFMETLSEPSNGETQAAFMIFRNIEERSAKKNEFQIIKQIFNSNSAIKNLYKKTTENLNTLRG
jgi:MoxR-like ATPase